MSVKKGFPDTTFNRQNRNYIEKVANSIIPDTTGASAGDTLAVGADGLEWTTPPVGIPDTTGASAGDVITLNEDGEAEWKPPSGLEWEEGEWTPSEDVTNAWINLSKTHAKPPSMFSIISTKNTYDSSSSTIYLVTYINFESMGLAGWASTSDDSTHIYGVANFSNRSTGSNIAVNLGASIKKPLSSTTDDDAEYPRYWAQENKIHASTNSASRYFRANTKFKWLAVWYPTSESEVVESV